MRPRALGTLLFVAALVLAAWFLLQRDARAPAPAAPLAAEPAATTTQHTPAELAAPQGREAGQLAEPARGAAPVESGAAQGDERMVLVRVVSRDGMPIADAEAHLWEEPQPAWMARPSRRTAADGRAAIRRALNGPFKLFVERRGFGSVRFGPTTTAGEHLIVLDPEAQLAATVLDDEGGPVQGVPLRLASAEHDSLEQGASTDSVTNAEGRALFAELRPGRYSVAAAPRAALLAPAETVWLSPGANEIVLRARRGPRAHGLVVSDGSDAAPVANATLATEPRPAWHPTTGADGRFSLAVERAGAQILVAAAGHAPSRVQVPAMALVEPAAGALPAWRIVLERETVLTGRVVDTTGAALQGAEVACIERNSDTPAVRAHCGADGVYMLSGLHPGREVVLVVRHRRLAPLLRAFTTPREGSADLGVLVCAGSGASLAVEARDATGKALAEARVVAVEAAPEGCGGLDESRRDALLDARGCALLEGLPPGSTTVQLWQRGSKAPLVRLVELRAGETTTIVFEDAPGAMMRGRVVGPDGKPVAGVGVSVDPVERDEQLAHGDSETDADGAYLVSGLDPAREYHISVWTPKAAAGSRALRGGVYGPMKPGADSIRIELEELPWRTLLVRGKDGLPVAGAEVEVMPLGGRPKDGQASDPSAPAGELLATDASGLARTPWPGDTPMRAIARSGGRVLASAEIDWSSAPDPFPLDER